jgi:hypothetical protein
MSLELEIGMKLNRDTSTMPGREELREALMTRLFSIGSGYRPGPTEPKLHDPIWTGNAILYGELADECIRQMAWSRSRVWTGQGEGVDDTDVVSLAPEGWKP